MSGDKAKRVVPLKEGLFKISESGEVAHLIGSRCQKCGDKFFPRRYTCLACGGRQLEDVPLSNTGKVWTYTVARQNTPVSLIKAPYVIAIVELPEGVMVQGVMENCDVDRVRIGMELKVTTKKVSRDPEGNDVITFEFEPV